MLQRRYAKQNHSHCPGQTTLTFSELCAVSFSWKAYGSKVVESQRTVAPCHNISHMRIYAYSNRYINICVCRRQNGTASEGGQAVQNHNWTYSVHRECPQHSSENRGALTVDCFDFITCFAGGKIRERTAMRFSSPNSYGQTRSVVKLFTNWRQLLC